MFNDYTVKKAVPRLVIAAILVNLSWVACQAAISTTNILGDGIGDLIRTLAIPGATGADFPTFSNMGGGTAAFSWVALIAGGGAGVIALFTGGVFAALGAILAALAALVLGFLVLMFRRFFIVTLVILSPLALVCWAIPGMEKWAKRWWDLFIKLLLMFPFVMAMFAVADVLAVVLKPTAGNFVGQLMLVFVRFAPFALMPLVFKVAGGAFGTLTGMVNDRGKGIFDRGKSWSKERAGTTKRAQIKSLHKQDQINDRKTDAIRMVAGGRRNWNGRRYNQEFTARGLASLEASDRKERSETALYGLEESMRNGTATDNQGIVQRTGSKSEQVAYLRDVAENHESADVRKAAKVGLAQRGATSELQQLQEQHVRRGPEGVTEWNDFMSENMDLVKAKSGGLAHTLSSTVSVAELPALNSRSLLGAKDELLATQSRASWDTLSQANTQRATQALISIQSNPDLRGSLDPQAPIGIAENGNLAQLNDTDLMALHGMVDSAALTIEPTDTSAVNRHATSTSNLQAEIAARGLSDSRVKQIISKVGEHEGINLYRFRYLWGTDEYVGVVAQDVLKSRPDAVRKSDSGYYFVDYKRLGITLRRFDK